MQDPNSFTNIPERYKRPEPPPKAEDAWDILGKRSVSANVYRPSIKPLVEAATVPGPASIAELARALQNNVDLIYEWVYSGLVPSLVEKFGDPLQA